MGSSNDSLTLRWNEFEANISSTFRDLKDNKDFADLTLVSADDQQVEVHKVVLAASSPFFQKILKKNAHQHPLIYMKGVTSSDLKAVMNYVYYGEANVPQENLNSFLVLADDLELKGLVRRDESNSQLQQSTQQVDQRPASSQVVPPLLVNNIDGGDKAAAAAATCLKNEQLDFFKMEEGDYGPLESGVDEQYEGGTEDDYLGDQDISLNQENEDFEKDHLVKYTMKIIEGAQMGKYKCTECGKESARRWHSLRHIEDVHFPGTYQYPCDQCDVVHDTKSKFYKHMNMKHGKKASK